jgi:hypothetical protein
MLFLMKKFCFSCLVFLVFNELPNAQVSHLVISQVYGAGGNSGATYNRDFVELFNPTNAPVSLAGYSIQYGTATGSTWTSRALSGIVAANSYFLIQMTTSGTNGSPLPAPDLAVTNTDLSSTAGKLALVNVTTALSGSCPGSGSLVDLVGYGTSANCWEGAATAPAPGGNANSLSRAGNGCTDTDNNAGDFAAAAASARNSASPANICTPANSINISTIAATPFCVQSSQAAAGTVDYASSGSFSGTFTAYLSDASGSFASPVAIGSVAVTGTSPSGSINISIPAGTTGGTGYKIRVDASNPSTTGTVSSAFEIVNGVKNVTAMAATEGQTSASLSWTNPTSCFNEVMVVAKQGSSISSTPSGDGTAYIADPVFTGSGSAFDGGKVVYKGTSSNVNVTALTTASNYYFKVFARYGSSWSTGVEMQVTSLGALNHLVISQLYGGGGNAGASYTNDFVELFNPTNTPINLSGYSLQCTSPVGNNWGANKLDLVGTIPAHGYFLVQLAGGTSGSPLITADQTGIISNISTTSGKIALVHSLTGLTGNCPVSNSYVDLVGFGAIADCSEGGANAPNITNTIALFRANGGCTDTDNNASDFSAASPSPRNSASPLNNCLEGAALPVRFSFFTAGERSNGIRLNWTNETEENISAYTVERSKDSRTFYTIGQVKASNNDQAKASYVYLDATPLRGNNYYRIAAVELSGRKIYSPLVRVRANSAGIDLMISPNPITGGELNVRTGDLPKGAYTIKIYNSNGQEVAAQLIVHAGGSVNKKVSLRQLMKGIYCLRINGSVHMQKHFLID